MPATTDAAVSDRSPASRAAAVGRASRAPWVSSSVRVAREHRSAYHATPPAPDRKVPALDNAEVAAAATDEAGGGPRAPLALPVLAELPELASLLAAVSEADGLLVRAAVELAELLDSDDIAAATGVSVEDWLGIAARQTRLDRRFLRRLARLLHRFPSLRDAAEADQLSYAQLRGLTLALRDAPRAIDPPLDRWLGAAIPQLQGADPDAIVEQAKQAISELAPTVQAADERDAHAARYLQLQPRLDGSGGRIFGELDAVGLALLDDATAPRPDQIRGPGGLGAARADNLLDWLTHTCTDRDSHGSDSANGRSAPDGGVHDDDGGRDGDGAGVDRGQVDRVAPTVLLRMSLDSLLDQDRAPAQLLTRLIGGKLWLSSEAARRLVAERGAQLRTVVIDDTGSVVGVGRRTRIPPGWLAEATLAVHDTCTGPLCHRPARDAQIDHAAPWWPTGPDRSPGSTDVDNLGPLCGKTNRGKEATGWRATQTADGQRRWHHPRTGLHITTVPATWRPPGPTHPPGDDPARGSPREGPPEGSPGDEPLPF